MELIFLDLNKILIFIIILLLLFFIGYKTFRNQIKFNDTFEGLSVGSLFYIKYIFLLLSFIILFISIFGVRLGDKKVQKHNNGIDMMFVLDVSKSMNVADIKDSNYIYTRLDVIKDSISKYVSTHKEDRFGLVIFAGDAISTIPLTIDHDIFLTFLQNVDYRNLTVQGSDFEKALTLGVDRFSTSLDRSKALVFISDGGDPDDIISKDTIKKIGGLVKGISYFVVGVGTNEGGKIIIGRDIFSSYQTYNGEYVISKINKTNLRDISDSLDGEFYKVSDIYDLEKLNKSITKLAKKAIESDVNGNKSDGGRILAMISFIFFIIYIILYMLEPKFYSLSKQKGIIK